MDQEQVNFRATIVENDDTPMEAPMEVAPTPSPPAVLEPPPLPVLEPPPPPRKELPDCCKTVYNEYPFEPMAHQSELAEALPMIFVGLGIAYVIGMLTGAVIFSPPSVCELA